ncbi:GNAT family N-acetyltransferase [Pseudodesulfovibrio senegalensis]|jgi:ribosomal protein S18 acetylase RimI-like enzyme|uniref:GNAT family N-acetyltransferase n=1 Tax=Pseudodesulfovibrio senegalensis TaxID=1721087 RepID=A0A6N6N212_9BACT|nr:N-acetyltransferase [Pseudodesulfovibrio senegalensis]KAB1442079.1 GNAT family N-acetyltransferase [Pseudodesulfovibrio senegalensis]
MPQPTIRTARPDDLTACIEIETVSFPPDEAASPASIEKRITSYAQGFLVAEQAGRVIGQINSGSTSKNDITDEAFKQLVGHDPNGTALVIFSLSVLPQFRHQGVAAALMDRFIAEARAMGKQRILLLCKERLVPFYRRFDYVDAGLSASTHGGSAWHEMRLEL